MYMVKKLLLSTLVLALFTVPALAVEYGGVGVRPANPDPDNQRSESIFLYEIEPGNSTEDEVLVTNNTSETKTINIYAVDAQTTNSGSFACRQEVEPRTAAGAWVQLDSGQVTLEPGTQTAVGFSVSVPENTDVGEHNACIVAAEADEDTEEDEDSGVTLSFRSALRAVITVPGDIEKGLEFSDISLEQMDDGSYVMKLNLDNTGNVSLDATIEARLLGMFGGDRENGGTFPVLAQDNAELRLAFERPFWGGFYRAEAEATYDSNPENRLGQEENQQLETISTNGGWMFIAPTPTALVIELAVLLLLLSVLAWLAYRHRSTAVSRKNWKQYEAGEEDDIKSLARKHDLSWKKLARVNKLKAPYIIKPGDKILVPTKRKTKQ